MQAVVLAAGKGVRLGELTKDRPKPLISINGRPLLEHALEQLPDTIKELIMVIGYHGDQLQKHFGDTYHGRPVRYCQLADTELTGTATALSKAKSLLHNRFLVIHGDDIHAKSDLEECLVHPLAYGVCKQYPKNAKGLSIEVSPEGFVTGAHPIQEAELSMGVFITCGAYVLDQRIFKEAPVRLASGEFGLPHTILELAKHTPVKAVRMDNWLSVTYPADIEAISTKLK